MSTPTRFEFRDKHGFLNVLHRAATPPLLIVTGEREARNPSMVWETELTLTIHYENHCAFTWTLHKYQAEVLRELVAWLEQAQ